MHQRFYHVINAPKKRKSPCATMPLFRSPLSRMFLSPRIPLPGARLGSPSVRHRTSPRIPLHGIDLNVEPEENDQDNVESGSDPEDNPHAQENADIGFDPEGDPHVQENDENGSNPEGDPHAQENARRNVTVPDETRRAIFHALLARARNGYLKRHDTGEVSVQFSVPVRTVQRIWKKGKSSVIL